MGDTLSGILGTDSNYEATAYQKGNAFDPGYLQAMQSRQGQIFDQQGDLANVLRDQMAGRGPAPEQTMYQQNVQDVIKNAQGAVASQRGVNPALATRMGANIQANQSQKMAQQTSLLSQQRQLAAQAQLQNLLNQQQSAVAGGLGQYVGANNAAMNANVNTAMGNQQAAEGIIGGLMNNAGKAFAMFSQGGEITKPPVMMADGGVANPTGGVPLEANVGPLSQIGQMLAGTGPQLMRPSSGFDMYSQKSDSGSQKPVAAAPQAPAPAGQPSLGVNTNLGTPTANPMGYAHGGQMPQAKAGGSVPGQAAVSGDSLKNDTVSAKLSPGEIVLPRSIAQHPNAPVLAAQFVAAIQARKGKRIA